MRVEALKAAWDRVHGCITESCNHCQRLTAWPISLNDSSCSNTDAVIIEILQIFQSCSGHRS